jgi:hypothetical protein
MYAVVALSLAALAALKPADAGESRGLYWRHFHRAVMPLTPEYQSRTLYLRLEKLRKLKKMQRERTLT